MFLFGVSLLSSTKLFYEDQLAICNLKLRIFNSSLFVIGILSFVTRKIHKPVSVCK